MPYKDPEKQKQAQQEYYLRNKAEVLERGNDRRRANRVRLSELKNKPCVDCGNSYPHYVMDFDHIGTDKIMNVARLVTLAGWNRVLAEIAKCELVCANCHRIRTWNRLQ